MLSAALVYHTQKKRTVLLVVFFFIILCIHALFLFTPFFQTGLLNAQQKKQPVQLVSSWHMQGNKNFLIKQRLISPALLHRKNMLQITYDLHGLCLLPGDASAIILQTNRQKSSVSLSRYGKNCYDGEQTVQIPLHDFSGFIPS